MFHELKENVSNAKSNKVMPIKNNSQVLIQKFNYVNDIACQSYNLSGKNITDQLQNLEKNTSFFKIGVIHPDKPFRIILELFSMLIILGQTIEIPMMICLDNMPITPSYEAYLYFVDIFFWIVMLLQFNIGIYDKGIFIKDRIVIAKNYLKSWFLLDFFANLPFESIFELFLVGNKQLTESQLTYLKFTKMLRILRLIRAVRIQQALKQLTQNFHINIEIASIFKFSKLIFIIALVAHYIACIYNLVMLQEISKYNIIDPTLIDKDWIQKYIYCIYWSMQTMLTIGYGDIPPTTFNMQLTAILAMLFSSIVFGYVMNRIGSIIQTFNTTPSQYKSVIMQLTLYLNKRKIHRKMQFRIKKYLEYLLKTRGFLGGMMEEKELHSLLSQQLREQMIQVGKILSKHVLFNKLFTKNLLDVIPRYLEEYQYSPDELVIVEDKTLYDNHIQQDDNHNFIYIMTEGHLHIIIKKTNTLIQNQSKESSLGIIEFFSGNHYYYSVQTIVFCTIYKLSLVEFKKQLKQTIFSKDKVEVLLRNNFNKQKMKCNKKIMLARQNKNASYVVNQITMLSLAGKFTINQIQRIFQPKIRREQLCSINLIPEIKINSVLQNTLRKSILLLRLIFFNLNLILQIANYLI